MSSRRVFEGVVYVLRTGCQWKALPKERFGSTSSIHKYFREWLKSEVTHSWFNRFGKLLVRYEKLADSREALVHLAAAIICWRRLLLCTDKFLVFAVPFPVAFLAIIAAAVSVAIIMPTVSVSRLVSRYIHVIIPLVPYEIDRPATSIVFVAMFVPMFCVTRRHVQIDWSIHHRHGADDYRLRIDNLRSREVSNIDLPIKAWLADTDRHAYIGGLGRNGKSNCDQDEEKLFHT